MASLIVAAPAQATFPGTNGRIAFQSTAPSTDGSIVTINPDGSGQQRITTPPAGYFDLYPDWSADGSRIAFKREGGPLAGLYTVASGGGPVTQVTTDPTDIEPAWSPTGTRIVFVSNNPNGLGRDLYLVNADGTGRSRITNLQSNLGEPDWSIDNRIVGREVGDQLFIVNPDGSGLHYLPGSGRIQPDWGPDATRIVYWDGSPGGISTINDDGSGQAVVTTNPGHSYPAWSPDGSTIAYLWDSGSSQTTGIYTVNTDGTGATRIVRDGVRPDWGPAPGSTPSYPRPKGATPFRVPLTPAFDQCVNSNRAHGAPLSFPSCNPPRQSSSQLTVGAPDANGKVANSVGSLLYRVVVGNPATPANEADLKIDVSVRGVLSRSDLTPYGGELSADAGLRITDRSNTPDPSGAGPGTVEDTSFPVTVPCSAGTCSVSTTANAVMPGAVVEGKRAIWQLDQVQVYDGGADGLASTTGDNTLFMDEGVFVP
jgi:TolB protein